MTAPSTSPEYSRSQKMVGAVILIVVLAVGLVIAIIAMFVALGHMPTWNA